MSTAASPHPISAPAQESFVAFRVAGGDYAVATASVDEVLRMVALTPVPDAPPWLAGVLNLRGRVVPVIDLRARMGHVIPPVSLTTPIVIASVDGRPVGLIVDEVVGMIAVAAADIVRQDADPGNALVEGIARVEGRLVFLADLRTISDGVDAVVPRGG